MLLGTLALSVGLYAFVRAGMDGTLARLAVASLSHAFGPGALAPLADILMY